MTLGRPVLTFALLCVVGCSAQYFLKNKNSGQCIDARGYPAMNANSNLQSWTCEVSTPLDKCDQIFFNDKREQLVGWRNGLCVDVSGVRSRKSGTNVQLWYCNNKPDDRRWYFDYQPGTQYFRIKNLDTGLCIDVVGMADRTNGKNIQQTPCEAYTLANTDHWWYKEPVKLALPQSMFFIRGMISGKCIDVSGNPALNNLANVQVWDCEWGYYRSDQVWYWSGTKVINHMSRKCIDVLGVKNRGNGVNIDQYDCRDNDDMDWQVEFMPGSKRFFRLRNKGSGTCLEVRGIPPSTANGATVQTYACQAFTSWDDHIWELVPSPFSEYLAGDC